jgi:multimeric flavodoxin WrbA
MADIEIRTGMPPTELEESEFKARFRGRFRDPLYEDVPNEIARLADVAWKAYEEGRKSPRTRRAGDRYADPDYELSIDWIEAKAAIEAAAIRHADKSVPSRILLVNASPRSEHTCPGEMSKTYRLVKAAEAVIVEAGMTTEILDLSRLASEFGRLIHPCKACFSTAPALCHWPCSCYPNHGLGQVNDWMNEIYPMWVAAHGIMIISPVHWYQAPAALKLMMDRLVCADGGNVDPTTTHGKDAQRAKQLELSGWPYPRHLAGRLFSVVVHGDSAGAESLRRMLADWLTDMHLVPAGPAALLDRYVGYYKAYATSHRELDDEMPLFEEVRNAARILNESVTRYRAGQRPAGAELHDPRPK